MFDPKGFAPIQVIGPPKFPRVFGYCNEEDTLKEIMEPGYFNSSKIILRPNSFVKVICKDAIAEIVVAKNQGTVTMRKEFMKIPIKTQVMPKRTKDGKFIKKNAKLSKTG